MKSREKNGNRMPVIGGAEDLVILALMAIVIPAVLLRVLG